MKNFRSILEGTSNGVIKNVKDEIKAYKNVKDEMEKKYLEVLKTILSGIKNIKDEITWDLLKKRFTKTPSFKSYNKDKMTSEDDFKHLI